jgi:hypothetical protein
MILCFCKFTEFTAVNIGKYVKFFKLRTLAQEDISCLVEFLHTRKVKTPSIACLALTGK